MNQPVRKKLENFSSKKLENSILNSIFGHVKTNKNDMTKIDFKTIKKYDSKNVYFFRTNQNVFGVTDRVFNKCKKLVEIVEEIDGVKLVNVTSNCEKKNTMFLEFSDNDLMIQVYINSNYISVGNHPYFGHSYFDEALKVGSSHVDVVVEFIKGYFTNKK